ncbi:hypothetical protein QAD02_012891 [Eretmocerus hayati]|uniref:Uncharacterized protein n=1 Tax=Eretmocerus hayati TaxID=131215 RepID=A0ACC2P3I8_9HYME|nr:hypothetical protein QAD02_012891 [Eretmocerus hayati]
MSRMNSIPVSVVERIFSNWTALKMAIDHGMGTSQQAREFCGYVVELISMNEKLNHSDVAAELADYMDEHFDTQLEDESEKYVAEEILRFRSLLDLNDSNQFESDINRLPATQSWIQTVRVSRHSDASASNGDKEENDRKNPSSSEMEVDGEGFTMVTKKKK